MKHDGQSEPPADRRSAWGGLAYWSGATLLVVALLIGIPIGLGYLHETGTPIHFTVGAILATIGIVIFGLTIHRPEMLLIAFPKPKRPEPRVIVTDPQQLLGIGLVTGGVVLALTGEVDYAIGLLGVSGVAVWVLRWFGL